MFGIPKLGNGIGLHRALRFYDEFGIPRDFFSARSIVVTGSNGKGSTTRFIYSLLQKKFERVGCFTSPHLIDITERFEINGVQISNRDFQNYKERVIDFNARLVKEGDAIGAFELLFYIAVQWFYQNDVESIAWEVGIGGRYDPTRTLFAKVAALTSLDLEHTELLGPTKELIAYDKLDVVRPGGDAVISLSVEKNLRERLHAYGVVSARTFHFLSDRYAIVNPSVIDGKQHFIVHEIGDQERAPDLAYMILLIGLHQAENALTAVETVKLFLSKHEKNISATEIAEALADVRWAGRMEKISNNPTIWIDVGHTPDALKRVISEFTQIYQHEQIVVVYGVSYNKNVSEITALIEGSFKEVVLTRAYKNGTDVDQLEETFQDKAIIQAKFNRIEDAVSYAVKIGTEQNKIIVVLGGLFLAVEFKYAFEGHDARLLQFF